MDSALVSLSSHSVAASAKMLTVAAGRDAAMPHSGGRSAPRRGELLPIGAVLPELLRRYHLAAPAAADGHDECS
jgi:hypothetical protein